MLSCQTRTDILTRKSLLKWSSMQVRLKAEEVTGHQVWNLDHLAEDEGQALVDELELRLKMRRANADAARACA